MDDAALLLHLALQPTVASAAAAIARAPAAQSKRLARALGASAASASSHAGASEWLRLQCAWVVKYRALFVKFKAACFRSAAAASHLAAHSRAVSSMR
jgi:hypothetical protein